MAQLQHAADTQLRRKPIRNSREIDWSRFLNRPLSTSCSSDWHNYVSGKTVLITGAGGSIGSALSLLLMAGLARKLIFLDRSEDNLRLLYRKYRERNLTLPEVKFLRADVRRADSLETIFAKYRPDIVFHAAAAKHVVPLESDPFAALEHNLLGTLRLLEVADSSSVECFVNVSTDKAVDPASVLGVSKRLAELLLLAVDSGLPRKLSLRLGNVLESSGSVVPLFVECLENRWPLPITNPEASRYFLTLEEAATFLLRSVQVSSSSLLLPEMGGPRNIGELANFLFEQFECQPCCQSMSFTGLRDGEKCFEQLTYGFEYLEETAVPELYRVCGNNISDPEEFADDLSRLLELVLHRQTTGLIASLARLVPEFTPSPTLLRHVC